MIKAAKERITRVNQIKNINRQVSRNSMDSNILMASSRESSVVNLRKNISGTDSVRTKGGFKSEDTGEFLHLQHIFQMTILSRKFEFPA